MNKTLQFLLVMLIVGGIAYWVSCRKEPTRALNGTSLLIVGTNAEYPPFTFRDNGEIVGFDIDIVQEVARRLGKSVELKDMSFSMLLPKLQSGSLQLVAAGVSPSPERESQVLFTKPYLKDDPLVVITRADHKPLTSIADLKGQEVVVNDGFTADLYVSQFEGPIIKRLPTVSDAFLALTNKRADAFVSAQAAIAPFFQIHDRTQFTIATLPEVSDSPLKASDSYVLMISRKYPELLSQVQETLDTMEKDGTIAKIKQKWNLS
jgi:polar amino acid transport system substrate-binding protein